MNGRLPLIVVSLPGRTVAEVRSEAETAVRAGADLAEVRFDRWTVAERGRASELFPSPLPLVATLRSRAEGGEGPDDPGERSVQLEGFARMPFAWLDLEAARDMHPPEPDGAHSLRARIVSTHLPDGSPTSEVARLATEVAPAGAVRKVVVPASVGSALRDLLPLLPGLSEREMVLLTTGPSGPLLRAWSRRWAYPLVFARLPDEGPDRQVDPVEPSQIPVDHLRHFFGGDERSPLFAILGHPVAHSRSPHLHMRWMRAAGMRGLYIALDIEGENELVEAMDPLAAGGFRGLNVTHPWKSAALEAATDVGPGAERCGAANCLTLRDGEIEAENTDLVAMLRRLEELRRSGDWDGKELAIVGTGGAAAATLVAAQEVRVPAHVFARDSRRASTLCDRFGASMGLRPEARPFSLVVHATDVGRGATGPLEVPLAELVGPNTRVIDWVYAPDDPSIRSTTERAGGRYEDGWRLLVYQAAASYGIWWGAEPSAEEVAAAIAEGP
jgi:shikimate dehydrogenase